MKTDLVVNGYVVNDGKVLLIHHKKLKLWLPPGGHIEKDETPDEALAREIKEELGLRIRFLNHSDIPLAGNVKRHLALPFDVNVHSVGDHDHCGFYYVAEALNLDELKKNEKELNDFAWFSEEELHQEKISPDVRHQALKALKHHNRRVND